MGWWTLVAAARLAGGPGSDFERVPKGRALPVRRDRTVTSPMLLSTGKDAELFCDWSANGRSQPLLVKG
jgi:hypothetical protein